MRSQEESNQLKVANLASREVEPVESHEHEQGTQPREVEPTESCDETHRCSTPREVETAKYLQEAILSIRTRRASPVASLPCVTAELEEKDVSLAV